ncbi:MAG: APC family permease [Acidobacteria bacterium]|nr:APC family permease [Acidobacteriota bacterium]MBV9624294.1 APC family permease [Acidobacteriota bacterium]
MAETSQEMKPSLGLTGLTMNAMALIAPGAFLWLTFYIQATTGTTAPAMWIGIFIALLLCLATAVSYAELAKLYPGPGSSYYFAEQSFLNHEKAWKYARLSKFIVGWGSHLYYWIYPGVMVAVTGLFVGYIVGTIWPTFQNASDPGLPFTVLVAILFSLGVAYIAQRGVSGSTAVNIGINIIQISALLVFSAMLLAYRVNHKPGSEAWQWDAASGEAYTYEFATTTSMVNGQPTDTIVRDSSGIPKPKLDSAGKAVAYHVGYPEKDASNNFLSHGSAKSVIGMHNFAWMFIQATVAILILVGFESCTALGAEAKRPQRDIPIAVITSLLVQGAFCYLFEYFCANYFLSSGYSMQNAATSSAPIGDMMVMVGDALFGSGHGKIFMLVEAFTVFLALIGTTLSCINTGARVTYAMGKDNEVPEHFGLLHAKKLTPHRAIWTLALISIVVAIVGLSVWAGDAGAPTDSAIQALPHGFWSSFGYSTHEKMAALPNTLLAVTLSSNFGTFLLYGLSCVICMVGYHKHPNFKVMRHFVIPLFGIIANLACMAFYVVGPFMGYGTKMEPLIALGVALVWAIYGGIYFVRASKATGRTTLVQTQAGASA